MFNSSDVCIQYNMYNIFYTFMPYIPMEQRLGGGTEGGWLCGPAHSFRNVRELTQMHASTHLALVTP